MTSANDYTDRPHALLVMDDGKRVPLPGMTPKAAFSLINAARQHGGHEIQTDDGLVDPSQVREIVWLPPCEFPSCERPAYRASGMVMEPEPISVRLCAEHFPLVRKCNEDADIRRENLDFWRWYLAMAGLRG
jgi:hypothetical protein